MLVALVLIASLLLTETPVLCLIRLRFEWLGKWIQKHNPQGQSVGGRGQQKAPDAALSIFTLCSLVLFWCCASNGVAIGPYFRDHENDWRLSIELFSADAV